MKEVQYVCVLLRTGEIWFGTRFQYTVQALVVTVVTFTAPDRTETQTGPDRTGQEGNGPNQARKETGLTPTQLSPSYAVVPRE